MMRVAVFGVLAGVYSRGYDASMLTHAVLVDESDDPVRVLCRRVQLDNLTESVMIGAGPTCRYCQRAMMPKRKRAGRSIYELRSDGQLDVFDVSTRSGVSFSFTMRTDDVSARHRLPADVFAWVNRQQGRTL